MLRSSGHNQSGKEIHRNVVPHPEDQGGKGRPEAEKDKARLNHSQTRSIKRTTRKPSSSRQGIADMKDATQARAEKQKDG